MVMLILQPADLWTVTTRMSSAEKRLSTHCSLRNIFDTQPVQQQPSSRTAHITKPARTEGRIRYASAPFAVNNREVSSGYCSFLLSYLTIPQA